MAITVKRDQLAVYRSAVSAADTADLATLVAAVFTRSSNPIPVVGCIGGPTVYVQGRASVASATIGLTLVYLNISSAGTVTVQGVGAAFTLTAPGTAPSDGSRYLAPVPFADAGGTIGPDLGAGVVTHYAVLCSTAPSSGNWDLYTWGA